MDILNYIKPICLLIVLKLSVQPVSALEVPSQIAENAPSLSIYVDKNTQTTFSEYPYPNPLSRLKSIMEKSGLDYQILYVPWNRALSNAQEQPNSFIYQLLRTEEREPHYDWVFRASAVEPLLLVGRKGIAKEQLMSNIKSGEFTAACFLGAAQCTKLVEFGFNEANLLQTTSSDPHNIEALLINDRVDFIPVFESEFLRGLRHYGQSAEAFYFYAELDDSVDYLAAAKSNVDPKLIEYLRIVAQGF